MKHKKILIIFLIFIFGYFYFFFNAKKIETLATFPGIGVNLQDAIGYEKAKINFQEINIKDKDGNNINGLYMTGTSEKSVYYFHGNGGPLNYFYDEIKYINDLGYSVFAYDYPGYGKSTGFPFKENVDEFSKTFFDYLKKEKNIDNKNLIIWGYSVGTAVATDFASKNDFDKLVLFSPFSSRYEMGGKYFFSFPPQRLFFIQNSYKTSDLVKNFKRPVLIIHGNNDLIIPFSQGEKVFNNYSWKEKYFIELDNFGHNYIISDFGQALKGIIYSFLNDEKLDFKTLFMDSQKKKELEKENEKLSEKIKTDIFLKSLDLKTDNSITKYVSNKVSFNDLKYIPNDLENIDGDFLTDVKGNQILRKEALENLQELSKDFYDNFNVKLSVVSAYRSYDYQVGIINGGCSLKFCSKPGFSEHQTGLAVDIFEATSEKEFLSKSNLKKYFEWLGKNAYKYGFTNSYKNGIEIDGYENEPWHWRYVGAEFAKYLQENDLSFGKFMNGTK